MTRLLQRLEPDPNALWTEAEPTIDRARGALILDTRQALRQAHRLGDPHWSGKHRKTVRGINLITLLWTDGDRKIPCDYRLYSKTDGKTKNYHFWEMMLMARGRGFSPKYVLFDSWYASLKVPGTSSGDSIPNFSELGMVSPGRRKGSSTLAGDPGLQYLFTIDSPGGNFTRRAAREPPRNLRNLK